MNFEQASNLGRRMRQASKEPQYLTEWCGDWCVSNYRPRGGLRCVVVEMDDFGPQQQERGEQRDMTLHSPFVVRVETKPNDFLDEMGERLRSIAEALSDLRAKYETYQTAELARMIRQLEAEIVDRKQTASAAH